jgi:hypothetical protein
MDIEIIVKGGEELSEWYPKNYEKFEKKISDLISEMFPGVGGWCISPELTDRHQGEKEQREKVRQEHFKQTLFSVLKKNPKLLRPAA